MLYREFAPSPHLAAHVECYWLLEGYNAPGVAEPERILPDGCVELIVNLSDRFHEHRGGGRVTVQPMRFVAGQMTRPVFVTPTGAVRVFGTRFLPGGTVRFIEGPVSEMTNLIVALDDCAFALSRAFEARLDPHASPVTLVAAADGILLECARSRVPRGASVAVATERIVRSAGQSSIDRMAYDLGISGRQLERRFLNEVGLGPKVLSRILRFQQVFRAVEREDAGWAAIAAQCGYYDQSHLIRDFRQFAGQSPAVLVEELSAFGEFFTRKHRASVSSNTARTI